MVSQEEKKEKKRDVGIMQKQKRYAKEAIRGAERFTTVRPCKGEQGVRAEPLFVVKMSIETFDASC